jgi:DNA-binding beta-propeller fold protein YncE
VADSARIQKFTNEGVFIRTWGGPGSGAGQFNRPSEVAVYLKNFVYVVDSNNTRIQRFTNDGQFTSAWGGTGTAPGRFTFPQGVAVDSGGNVFVAERHRIQKFHIANPCPTGTTQVGTDICFITQWGSFGSDDGKFNFPIGLAIKSGEVSFLQQRVYVSDTRNNRIQVFRPELISDT